MKRNLFEGKGHKAEFARIAYQLLMKREWITYGDMMDAKIGIKQDYSVCALTSYTDPPYAALKKVFPALCDLICEEVGGKVIEEEGNNRTKRFRYVGEPTDPLKELLEVRKIKSIEAYYQFCQDSSSVLPMVWMEYFLEDTIDLQEIKSRKQKGEQIMETSADRELKNVEMLPDFYAAIKNKMVLSLEYKGQQLVFHPQYIKEFNDRWYVFGVKEGDSEICMLPLDRITQAPKPMMKIAYQAAEKGFYTQYFQHLVGVTFHPTPVEEVCLRAHTAYMFDLIDSKPIHSSQQVKKPFGEYEGKAYGEFVLMVKTNPELIGRILQHGAELEVMSPPRLRASIAKRARQMACLYDEEQP